MNPATFMRVLGPEPWNVAYVEPSVRPDDGRYGENPYRMQQFYQYQVILKPAPENSQELYLRSLQVLGIDPAEHDIRFVEDNWEQPAIGSWGLGWEVWLDGQELTQFTYFQQSGGQVLEPISVEITYGLERIAMPLQRVRNYRDIQFAPGITYGELHYKTEQEQSRYYFDFADVANVRAQYDLYMAEARRSLEAGLVLPAHDYILKCSHAFNILDTRGAIGVTERQAFFRQMRDLSRRNAEAYLAQREALAYPLLKREDEPQQSLPAQPDVLPEIETESADLLVEIGTEELPASDLQTALEQLETLLPAALAEARLAYKRLDIFGTPRRLVMMVTGLATHQTDLESEVKGPPANRAFGPDGSPTPAAIGFARSKGQDVSALRVKEIDGGQYVVINVHERGKSAVCVLMDLIPGLIADIRFDKSMRWNDSGVTFSRPIRWLLGLYGGQALPYHYAGLTAQGATRGLRFHAGDQAETVDELSRPLDVDSISAYLAAMDAEGIIIDPARRREMIVDQLEQAAGHAGGSVKLDEKLLDEVVNLVEAPTAFLGSFDPARLSLPVEVVVSVMQKYQRYFPLVDSTGRMMPNYLGVRNGGTAHLDIVAGGNDVVLGARYADAAFFIADDEQHKLEDFLPRLDTLVFQSRLGSVKDKTERIVRLTDVLADTLGLDGDEKSAAMRAALLSKADMVSKMVVEMTSVQGIMGRYYALRAGEDPAVANAIFEHLLPRYPGDAVPASMAGLVIGLADRLDSLMGLFAAGLAPSGAKDPFAQRRTALGLIQLLLDKDIRFDLRDGLKDAAANLPIPADEKTRSDCFEFITARLRNQLVEQGYRYDIVDAVLARQAADPAASLADIKALSSLADRPDWPAVLPAYARCARITRGQDVPVTVAQAALREPAEVALYHAIEAQQDAGPIETIPEFIARFEPLVPAINRFFDEVLVMSEDTQERDNRLAMLGQIAAMTSRVADFSVLEGF